MSEVCKLQHDIITDGQHTAVRYIDFFDYFNYNTKKQRMPQPLGLRCVRCFGQEVSDMCAAVSYISQYRGFKPVIAAAAGFALIISVLFMVCAPGHNCTGDRCPTCLGLDVCRSVFSACAAASVFAVHTCSVLCQGSAGEAAAPRSCKTLITLSVKLSN